MARPVSGRLQWLLEVLSLPDDRRAACRRYVVELDRALRRNQGSPKKAVEAAKERWCSRGLSKGAVTWLADVLSGPARRCTRDVQ